MVSDLEIAKARREGMRWYLLSTLHKARPVGAMDVMLLNVIGAIYDSVTPNELHCELEYLENRKLIVINKQPAGHWHSTLSHIGVDVVEYTAECYAGIARPKVYWG